jgi:hypothetical protein
MRTMTASVQLKKNAGRGSQGACRQDELIRAQSYNVFKIDGTAHELTYFPQKLEAACGIVDISTRTGNLVFT